MDYKNFHTHYYFIKELIIMKFKFKQPKINQVQQFVLITLLLVFLWFSDMILPFLGNPIWIGIFQYSSWILGLMVLILWLCYAYVQMKEELWRRFEKELERLKKA